MYVGCKSHVGVGDGMGGSRGMGVGVGWFGGHTSHLLYNYIIRTEIINYKVFVSLNVIFPINIQ